MKIFIGGILLGTLLTWGSNILFIGWYLKERDEEILKLEKENRILKLKEEQLIGHIEKTLKQCYKETEEKEGEIEKC